MILSTTNKPDKKVLFEREYRSRVTRFVKQPKRRSRKVRTHEAIAPLESAKIRRTGLWRPRIMKKYIYTIFPARGVAYEVSTVEAVRILSVRLWTLRMWMKYGFDAVIYIKEQK